MSLRPIVRALIVPILGLSTEPRLPVPQAEGVPMPETTDTDILGLIRQKAQDLREAQGHVIRIKRELADIRKGLAGAIAGGKKRAPRKPKDATAPVKKSRRRGMPKPKPESTTEG